MVRQSGFKIMKRLILELKPLIPVMCVTILFGVIGFLSAISINTLGALAIGTVLDKSIKISFTTIIILMATFAVLRGPLRYIEQLSGHYVAFKILAILRDKIFTALRKLAPAKLESKEKGNLVALITSDIELLEVFYAHTIAPISIAVITNTIVTIVLWSINPYFGILGAIFFIIVGFFIPYFTSKIGKNAGVQYRNAFAKSNSYLLDALRGIKEILIYKNGKIVGEKIHNASESLNEKQSKIKLHEAIIRTLTDFIIMISIVIFLIVGTSLVISNKISIAMMIVAVVLISSSFGPVVALSNLSNNLIQTFASAERVFALLDEEPEVNEIPGNIQLDSFNIKYDNVSFAYENREEILKNININIKEKEKIAIVGDSGTGKSTFVKLLMRFWDTKKGHIYLGNENLKSLPTKTLRKNESLMSQETYLFNKTIEDNIKIGNLNATREEVIKAAKKASIDEFIQNLPNGYETKVGELGNNLSSGEKQRIGLARAFLSNGDILILDEPTSNLDTLNEGQILKSINENSEEKTIILITHRKSTTSICDKVLKLENKQLNYI